MLQWNREMRMKHPEVWRDEKRRVGGVADKIALACLMGHAVTEVAAIGEDEDYTGGFRLTFANGTRLRLETYNDAMLGRGWDVEIEVKSDDCSPHPVPGDKDYVATA